MERYLPPKPILRYTETVGLAINTRSSGDPLAVLRTAADILLPQHSSNGDRDELASPFGDLGKMLLVIGIALAAIGALLLFGLKLPFRLGRLPGDIAYQGRHGSFYFPITTCIVLQ